MAAQCILAFLDYAWRWGGSDASFMIVPQRSYGLGFVSCKVFKEMGKTIPGSAPSVGRWPVESRKSAVIEPPTFSGGQRISDFTAL